MKRINEKQWKLFKQAAETNSVVGSYLLCGPWGVGKNELVLDFITMVNDTSDKEKIERGADPDVIFIEGEIEKKKGKNGEKIRKKDITIDQVKEGLKKVGYYAYNAKFKFLVIKDAEKMNNTAANKLLKTIEEPTSDTVVILISNNEMGILSTIRSRCQIVRFGLLTDKEITTQLQRENIEFEKEELSEFAQLAHGRIQQARKLLRDPELFNVTKQFAGMFRDVFKKGVIEGFRMSEELADDKEKLLEALTEMIWYLRGFLREQLEVNADKRIIKKIFRMTREASILRAKIASSNVNQRLQLENFFVQL